VKLSHKQTTTSRRSSDNEHGQDPSHKYPNSPESAVCKHLGRAFAPALESVFPVNTVANPAWFVGFVLRTCAMIVMLVKPKCGNQHMNLFQLFIPKLESPIIVARRSLSLPPRRLFRWRFFRG
jgi:hypothetical protein